MKRFNCWGEFLANESKKKYFQELRSYLRDRSIDANIYPAKDKVFRIFQETDIRNIRVCIIGQDPYHTPGVACGVAFGVKKGYTSPPSLRNISKELKSDINVNLEDTELMSWVKQGVFLINSLLTVEEGKPRSHANIGWEEFVGNAINSILIANPFVVFILWGKKAQATLEKVLKSSDVINSYRTICSAHPSPFSSHKFFGSKPFSKTNRFLKEAGLNEINWGQVIF